MAPMAALAKHYACPDCERRWYADAGTKNAKHCPKCGGPAVEIED